MSDVGWTIRPRWLDVEPHPLGTPLLSADPGELQASMRDYFERRRAEDEAAALVAWSALDQEVT